MNRVSFFKKRLTSSGRFLLLLVLILACSFSYIKIASAKEIIIGTGTDTIGVGGNSNPAYKLNVAGIINSTGLCLSGDCKATWGDIVASGGGNQWTTLGANIYNSNSGNVGIGTSSPAAALDVFGKIKINSTGTIYNVDSNRYLDMAGIMGDSLKVSGNLYSTAGALKIDGTGNSYVMGNLGIGATNPGAKLSVDAGSVVVGGAVITGGYGGNTPVLTVAKSYGAGSVNIDLTGDIANYPSTIRAGQYGMQLLTQSNGGIFLMPNGAGNVGIGTSSPAAKLDVNGRVWSNDLYLGSSRTLNAYGFPLAASGVGGKIFFGSENSDYATVYSYATSSVTALNFEIGDDIGMDYFDFRSQTASLLRINTSGSVGIGTTVPSAKLDVLGSFRVSGALNSVVLDRLSGTGNRIVMTDSSGSLYATSSDIASGLPAPSTNGATLRSDGGAWISNTVIYNNGTNVGIGTTGPAGKLNINETTGTAYGAAQGSLIIDHANGGGASSVVFRSAANRGSDFGFIQYQDAATVGGAGESARLIIGTSNDADDHLLLMPTGNVGIGTVTPAAKLDIWGSLKSDSGNLSTDGLANITAESFSDRTNVLYKLDPSNTGTSLNVAGGIAAAGAGNSYIMGNLGIGMNAPNQKLDVNGNINLPNGGIITPSGSSWISQKTATNVPIKESNNENAGSSYKAFIQSTNKDYTYTLGRLSNSYIGFFGYASSTTSNNADIAAYLDNSNVWRSTGLSANYATISGLAGCTGTGAVLKTDASGRLVCGTTTGGVTGSGTTNYVARWTGSNTLGSGILYDNGTNVGIGTVTPVAKLDIWGSLKSDSGNLSTDGLANITAESFSDRTNVLYKLDPSNTGTSLNVAGGLTAAGIVRGSQLISAIAAGTAPLVVTSNTVVANLNADLLDGIHATDLTRPVASTSGGSGSDLGYWTKIASIDLGTGSYSEFATILGFAGSGGSATNAIVSFTGRQSTAAAPAPGVMKISILSLNEGLEAIADDSFKIVSEGFGTPFEIYMKKNTAWGAFRVYELTKTSVSATTYYTNYGWSATEPTGTYTAISNGLLHSGLATFNNIVDLGLTSGYLPYANSSKQLTNSLIYTNGTNTGIGTTAPSAKLDVLGSFRVSGALNSVVLDRLSGTGNRIVMTDSSGSLYATSSDIASGLPTAGALGSTLYSNGSKWTATTNLYSNGTNVGIGTTTPGSKLDVALGSISIGSSNTSNGLRSGLKIYSFDSGAQQLGTLEANYADNMRTIHLFGNSNTGQIKIDTSASNGKIILFPGTGNVGIGTNNPGSKLHVTGKTQVTDGIAGADTGAYSTFGVTREASSSPLSYIAMTRSGAAVKAMGIDSGNNWLFGAPTASTQIISNPWLVITPSGNIGVGATSPLSKLSIGGNGNANYALNVTATSQQYGTYSSASTYGVYGSGGTYGISGSGGTAGVRASGGGYGVHATGVYGVLSNGSMYDFYGENAAGKSYFAGNVGIGSSTPALKLVVDGSAQFNNSVIVGTPTATNHAVTKSYLDSAISSVGNITNIQSLGNGLNAEINREIKKPGVYTYSTYSGGTGGPSTYNQILTWGSGNSAIQIGGDWFQSSYTPLYVRSLRDSINNWTPWTRILTDYIDPYAASMNQYVSTTASPSFYAGSFSQAITVGSPTIASHATTKSYVDSAIAASGIGAGTANQTLRHNGTSWVASSLLYNNGSSIGIGTSNLYSKLQVAGDIATDVGNRISPVASDMGAAYLKYDETSPDARFVLYGYYGLRFDTAGGTRMVVRSDGNIGIGTTAPSAKLQVIGNTKIGSNNNQGLWVDSTSSPDWGTQLYLTQDLSSAQGAIKLSADYSLGSGAPNFVLSRSTNSQAYGSNPNSLTYSPALMVNGANGNVGIGTTNPIAKVHILKNSDSANENSGGISITSTGANTNAKLIIGAVGDSYSYIQSMQSNTSWYSRPLVLQPNTTSRVGIGTTNPATSLEVTGTDSGTTPGNTTSAIRITNTATAYLATTELQFASVPGKKTAAMGSILLDGSGNSVGDLFFATRNSAADTNLTERMRILYNGNVGIGTTNPTYKLYVAGVTYSSGNIITSGQVQANGGTNYGSNSGYSFYGSGGDTDGGMFSPADGTVVFATNNVERLRINSSGAVSIGTTNPDIYKLYINGAARATSFAYESDRSLKKNIATISDPLAKIMELRGVTFNWKKTNNPSVGLIAQEVETVFPELVSESNGIKTVEYGNLVAPLIEAVKAQQQEIESLNERLKALEAKK